jgi:hypothetical protein
VANLKKIMEVRVQKSWKETIKLYFQFILMNKWMYQGTKRLQFLLNNWSLFDGAFVFSRRTAESQRTSLSYT